MAFTYNGATKKIILSAGTTAVSVVDMWSRYVDWLAIADNSKYLPAMRTVGGDPVSATQNLGITFFLTNGWRIVPQSADHRLVITGNLYTDPFGGSVADVVPGYSVVVEAAVSNLVDSSVARLDVQNIQRLIEGLRSDHKGFGKIIFWSPSAGSDLNDGRTPESAVSTFAQAHALATDWGHDIINLMPTAGGATVVTEPLTISKNFVFVRGAGYNAHLHPTTLTAGGNLLEISGAGVELSGLHIEGVNIAAANTNGIAVTGNHVLIKNVTVEECTGHGVVINSSMLDDRSHIENCVFRANGKSGLQVNVSHYLTLKDTVFEGNAAHGVDLAGAGAVEDTFIENCHLLRNGGYGLNIANPSVEGTTIDADCLIEHNVSGNIFDSGLNTVNQMTVNNTAASSAVWAKALEGLTAEEMLRVMLAALAGKRQGLGTATEQYMARDGTTPRITLAGFDVNGNGTPSVNGAP